MTKLAESTVLITGAAMGIGRELALCFAEMGASIAIADFEPAGLEETRQQVHKWTPQVLSVVADVGDLEGTERIVRETYDRFGRLQIVVNNAANTRLNRTVQEMTIEEWDVCIDVTLRSVFLISKFAAPLIRNSGGGAIINLASVGAVTPWQGGAAYCAAKAGVLALTKVLAAEYSSWNIRVNSVSPGPIQTPNLEESIKLRGTDAHLTARTLLRRIGTPREVAEAVAFLASPEASYITGVNLPVDGGWLAM
jgi:NAD(P)-dependent dehydrogenase (short-subunit alcohol dehydrogenase family)